MLFKPAKDSVDLLIFVSDIRQSLDFYQGILGLEKTQEVQTPFGTVHRLRFGTSLVKLMDPKQAPPAGPIRADGCTRLSCFGRQAFPAPSRVPSGRGSIPGDSSLRLRTHYRAAYPLLQCRNCCGTHKNHP
jgi:catechol 2,3-dioxygenase-like lactoylglutathione lyase family enzyme